MATNTGDEQDASRLTGTYWGMIYIRDSGGQTDISDVNGYLHITDQGQLGWRVGNSQTGRASIEGDRIRYVIETSTLVMLKGRYADIHAAVALLLESRPHWRIDGDRLRLRDDAGNALICRVRSEEQVFRRR